MEQEHMVDLDLNDFFLKLFSNPPFPPNSMRIELDNTSSQNFFSMFINLGAEKLFNTTFNLLTEEQCGILNKYVNSLGYESKYNVKLIGDKLHVSVDINKLTIQEN